MKINTSPLVFRHSQGLNAEATIREGMDMAAREGEAAFETVELRHAADLKEAEIEAHSVQVKGNLALQLRDAVKAKLDALGFNVAAHLHDIARGRLDLKEAIALLLVSAALLILTLLAFSPPLLVPVLALLVLGSVGVVEEFFAAHREADTFRESVFLALSATGLLGQYWLATVRSKLIAAATPDYGPVSHILAQAGPLVAAALGVLALVLEIYCGWKLHMARMRLLSPTARAFREQERLNGQLAGFARALKQIEAAPAIARHYRIIGIRQQLAWASGEEQRIRATHLSRAAKAALVALIIAAALFLLAGRLFASQPVDEIVFLDSSKSVAPAVLNTNIGRVTDLIRTLQPGDHLAVLPIGDGFSNSMLLNASMPTSSGYLGLQQTSGREAILTAWKHVAGTLHPAYAHTDIFSALALVQYLPHSSYRTTRIVVLSDLEQSTPACDFGRLRSIPVASTIAKLTAAKRIPPLNGIDVYLVVDPAGKSAGYLESLHQFWATFFAAAGARLKSFSIGFTSP